MQVLQEGRFPSLRVDARGVVAEGVPDSPSRSCAFPQVCVTPAGRWLCAFRAAPTKAGTIGQRTLLTWSDDKGRTWSTPKEPFPPQYIDGRLGLIRSAGLTALDGNRLVAVLCWVDHTDPDKPFFNETTEGLLDTRILTSFSEDAGETWCAPRLIGTTPYTMPTPITGPIRVMPSGEWMLQFELNKHYDEPQPWEHASVLMFSSDNGATWPRHVMPAKDATNRVFYWDQRPAVFPDGRILNVFWTFDRQDAVYLNMHATDSVDGGRSWAPVWDTGVPGQPAPPVLLPDGTIALAYVDRTGPPAIKMRRSTDGGRSFPDGTEITIHESALPKQEGEKETMQDAWAEMEKFSLGLPCTAPLPDGGILVMYYAGPKTDVTSVLWAVIR